MVIKNKVFIAIIILSLKCTTSQSSVKEKKSHVSKVLKFLKIDKEIAPTVIGRRIFQLLQSPGLPEIKEKEFDMICEKVRLQVELRQAHDKFRNDLSQLRQPIMQRYYAIIHNHPFDIIQKNETIFPLFRSEQGHEEIALSIFVKMYKKSYIAQLNEQMLGTYYQLLFSVDHTINEALQKVYQDLKIKTTADLLQHSS